MQILMLLLIRPLLKLLYNYKAYNSEVLATEGPVILMPNHVSWLDFLFIASLLDDDWHYISSRTTAQFSWIHRKIMRHKRAFPIDPMSPYSLKEVAKFLKNGGKLVIFPEGHITRNGNLRKLFDGPGFLLNKTNAKIITCYFKNLVRIKFVRHKGWTKFFPKVSAHFSSVLSAPTFPEGLKISEKRTRLTAWLRDTMLKQQFNIESQFGYKTPLESIRQMANTLPNKMIMEDTLHTRLTFKKFMLGVNIIARELNKIISPTSNNSPTPLVGILLPNVCTTPIAIVSLWSIGKAPAMLNFSLGATAMRSCAELAKLKEIITSRTFVEKAGLDIKACVPENVKVIYLEDVKANINKVKALFIAFAYKFFKPLIDITRNAPITPNDTAYVLFTSGSEGTPKGVDLTHGNISTNCLQAALSSDFLDEDRCFNALPMFHSFGLTMGTIYPLVQGNYIYLYPTPLHYRVIPAVVYDRDCTIIYATNTFLNAYARRCHPYDFQSIRRVYGAGEKIQESTRELWSNKIGVRIFEGYGATECSPLLTGQSPIEPRKGSVGKFVPGVEYKFENVDGIENGGRLFVKGPNVMRGYLNLEANAHFQSLNGWYDTGDIVKVDDEGFVYIQGRVKRFAKIAGEMVSLVAVEDALNEVFFKLYNNSLVAICIKYSPDKGETLVAVANTEKIKLDEIRTILHEKGFTNLCVPKIITYVNQIPLLGTGKVNYKELEKLII